MRRFIGTFMHALSFGISALMLWLYFVSPSVFTEQPRTPQVASAVSFAASSAMPNPNEILRLVNEQRISQNLEPLHADALLAQVAEDRAVSMAAEGYYSHTSPSGKSYFDLLKAKSTAPSFACENLGLESSKSANLFVESWLTSQRGHKECLLSTRTTRAGYAVREMYRNGSEVHFVVVAIHASN